MSTSQKKHMSTSQKKSIARRAWLLTMAAAATLAMGCIVPVAQGGSQDATRVVVGGGARAIFEIDNRSAESICYVHLSPTTDSNWGPDRLGSTEVIGSGVNRSWTLPVGNYDFQLQDCDHQRMMERRGIGIGSNGLVITYRVRE